MPKAKDVIERQTQVEAFQQALQVSHDIGLPIVTVTFHTALCVTHRIEELEERIDELLHEKMMEAMR